MSTEELIASQPKLEGKKVYTVDCIKIAQETIGKAIPNTPMLGALMKVSEMYDIEFFKESMIKVLKKLPQKIIDANMIAIQRAYDEVK
jgi:pyruvate ferredoxin oxidoreductase gamma subunit